MASSFGYRPFKTESIEEMNWEQMKVLLYTTIEMNKQMQEAASTGVSNGFAGINEPKKEKKTFRITNED